MKKVLVFNGYYIPAKNYGGPTTSLVNITNYCSDEFDFYIVAANHDLNDSTIFEGIHDGWNQVGKANVLYLDTRSIRNDVDAIKRIIIDVQPDLVWLVGILTPSHWTQAKACREAGVPYIISPRGEVCKNTFHMKYMKKSVAALWVKLCQKYKNAYYHATSEEEFEGLIKYYSVPKERIILVPNIPKKIHAERRIIEKNEGELRIVFISRIQEKKNLLTAIQAVNKLVGDVVFDIYGPIESEEYWKKCKQEIGSNEGVKINYRGQLNSEEVGETFAKYHVFLFPTVSENYGHAIAEALSVSCPIVLSKGTTPWDDLDKRGGFICELANINQYVEALKNLQAFNQDAYDKLVLETGRYYDEKINSDNSVLRHRKMLNFVIQDSKSNK